MNMTVGGSNRIAAGFIQGTEDVNHDPNIIEVEFRDLSGGVNQYIKFDINSQTLTKVQFKTLISKKITSGSPNELMIFNGYGTWEKPLLKDNPDFVNAVKKHKLFHVRTM